jgi:outer membrane receptor for ferric coprogen and ferric-rhodotorulic acid
VKTSLRSSVCLVGALGLSALPSAFAADAATETELDTVLITAQRAERVSRGATGLDLDIKDTPQSISVVTAELMQDFGLNSINDALRLATGINVEEWETNRTNYLARGFEIKNTQVDGIGLPNGWGIVTGAMDAFGYEKLEVIRGANGLLTGVGNSSGSINYVRKRPTNDRRGEVNLSAGSWSGKRIEADYSTPFTDSGSWAGRVVAAYDDSDSWLRGLKNDRLYLYGVVDGQIGDRTTLTFGYSFQDANTDGNMWGALVLANNDGTQAEFPRSASPTQDWTYWDTKNRTAFAEATYALPGDWTLKGTYNYRKSSSDDQLFYVYTQGIYNEDYTELLVPPGLDPDTALGLYGYPGKYTDSDSAHLFDVSIAGRFAAFGRDHDLILGLAQAHSSGLMDTWPAPFVVPGETEPQAAWGALPAFPYAGDAIPEPVWGEPADYDGAGHYEHHGQWLRRVYGASRLALGERVKAVLGFNLARFHRQGVNDAGTYYEQTESKFSPYAGLTVDLTDRLLAYASYSDIYQPQEQYDIDHNYLAPSKGVNLEVGAKAEWLDGRVLTSLAWFKAKQDGLATFAGMDDAGMYYYEGVDVDSKGIEFEVTGKLTDYAELVLGFTSLKLTGEDGERIYEWVPRRTANLAFSSRLPALPQLRLGVGGRWQNGISRVDATTSVLLRQDSYALLNLFGEWRVNEHLGLRANANNVTGAKYITSLYEVGYYGAGRNYSFGIDYRF